MSAALRGIFSLIVLLLMGVMGTFGALAQTSTGETTIFFGTPDAQPGVLNGVGFSTSDIDPLIELASGNPSVTKNLANEAFGDLSQFKQDLSVQMRNAFLAIPEVSSVQHANVQANQILVRLTQPGTSVGVMLSGLSVSTSFVYHPTGFIGLLCPTATISATLSDVSVFTEYNVYSGNIENTSVNYSIVPNVDCQGVIASLAQTIGEVFFGDAEARLKLEIRDAADSLVQNGNMQTLFSLEDFLDGLRQYGDIIENYYFQIPAQATIDLQGFEQFFDFGVGSTITVETPQLPFDISQEVNRVIDVAQGVVSSFSGTNLQLDILLFDGPTNQISFVVSQQAIRIGSTNVEVDTLITLNVPPKTDSFELFVRAGNQLPWIPLTSTEYITAPVVNRVVPLLPAGTQIVAVGYRSAFPELYSLPSNTAIVEESYPCFGNGAGWCDQAAY